MCGVAGILHLYGGNVDSGLIKRMCDIIAHRGPDDCGYFVDNNVSLGMRRLSIIDLNTGHQPIYNKDKSVVVILNGEIYNFQELRKNLQKKGHRFYTKTDTEVIVHLYEEHGDDCVTHLRGMFAFALWDKNKQRLLVARDRLGQKPLYYTLVGNTLFFGSEIKQLLLADKIERKVNFEALNAYLSVGYVPGENTLFQNILRLSPGHYMTVENGQVRIHKYWDVSYANRLDSIKESEIIERLDELIRESIRLRLISDVPLGAFLSGGIDSSTLVGYMSQLSNSSTKTFSVGFPVEKFNEISFARIASNHFQTDHYEYTMEKLSTDLLEKLVWHHDEPLGDSSCLPMYFVSRLARQHVTVALSGEGADEIFAGYHHYPLEKMGQYYDLLPNSIKNAVYALSKNILTKERNAQIIQGFWAAKQNKSFRPACWMAVFNEEEKKDLLLTGSYPHNNNPYSVYENYFKQCSSHNYLEKALYLDEKVYLPDDLLMKADKMSMANSLEARSPFLDHKLIEFVAQIPPGFKLRGKVGKYILKETVKDFVPREIVFRRKHGFNVPIQTWLSGWLEDYAREFLNEKFIKRQGIFNPEYIRLIWDLMEKKAYNYDRRIWLLLMFQIWYGIFIEGTIDIHA